MASMMSNFELGGGGGGGGGGGDDDDDEPSILSGWCLPVIIPPALIFN